MSYDDDDYVSVDIDRLVHETDMAVLVVIEDVEQWIPKSCIHGEVDDTDPCLDVARWFAEKEGLV